MANRVIRSEGKVEVKDSSLVPFFGVQPILVSPKVSRIIHYNMYMYVCVYVCIYYVCVTGCQ